MTMKTYKLLLLGLGALWFTSCEKELDRDLTDVSVSVATNENVRYEGEYPDSKEGNTNRIPFAWRSGLCIFL